MRQIHHPIGRPTAPLTAFPLAAILAGAVVAVAAAPASAQEPAAAEQAIEVTEAVVATSVEDRAPLGVAESFGADVGRLYFYTIVEGDFPATQLEHVWLQDGEEVARVPLKAEGPRWRTWSSKVMPPEPVGEWEVRVVGEDDQVLASTTFTVGG